VFGEVCEVIVVGVEFWIFPGVVLSRASRSARGDALKMDISIVGSSFLRVREHGVGF
jgi:hypothetical protein